MFTPDMLIKTAEALNVGRNAFQGSDMVSAIGTKFGLSKTTENGNQTADRPTNTPADRPSGDTTFSQAPQEIQNKSGTSGGIDSNILAFPPNLGTDNRQHFVKFDIFLVKTENVNLLGGKKDAKPAYDEQALPRNAQNQGGVVSDFQKNQVKYTKLQEMIGLPIPDSILSDYSMMWSRAEGGMLSGVVSLADTITNPEQRAKYSFATHAALGLGSGISNLASQVGLDGAETNLKLLTKRASNPRNEFLFDGVNNRSFNLTWKFIPKDAKESELIHEISTKLKLYMHPELDESTAGKFYIFPGVFDITFMVGSKENEYLPRTTTCALTNVLVNHSGGGMASFYEGTGAPFAIDMTLQFTELEFLHRKRFKTDANPDGVAR